MKRKPKKSKPKLLGVCVECGEPCYYWHIYIVRTHVWNAAGMPEWDSGYLHLPCLEKRLGRKVERSELLVRYVGDESNPFTFKALPDYLTSPEYLNAKPHQR